MIRCEEIKHGSKEYQEAVSLRFEILRKPLGLEFSKEQLEAESNSFHLVCFDGERIVACVILEPKSENNKFKMRQVAVARDYQGQGVGSKLVKFSEAFAKSKGVKTMVLNARETASDFYQKLGYQRHGEQFLEVGIPHFYYEKTL